MASITVFVYNNCRSDARVLKEAESLANEGHDVKILAILDKLTEPYEERNGFKIVRLVKDPLHYRILKFVRKVAAVFAAILKFPFTLGSKKKPATAKTAGDDVVDPFANNAAPKAEEPKMPEGFGALVRQPLSGEVLSKLLKKHPIPFLLFGWLILLIYNVLLLIKNMLYGGLKRFLMIFHRPLCFLDYYGKALKVVRNEPTDFYHGHDLNTLPAAYLGAKRTKGKVVYDSHELWVEISTFTKIERIYYKWLERWLAPKVNRVITVNESIAEELSQRYGIDKPEVVMNCPVVKGRVNPDSGDLLRERVGLPADEPMILYQGGFAPNRGLQDLIKSMAYVERGTLVFMGWGLIEPELRKLTQKLNLEDRIRFTGPVKQEVLLDYTKSADVGVIPYQFVGLNNYYTSPNKLFEYINAGVPIAGSFFPELKRVIGEYDIGATFDPEDPKSIAEAINRMLNDEAALAQMKANTQKAAERYTWENESQKLIRVYEDLVHEAAL